MKLPAPRISRRALEGFVLLAGLALGLWLGMWTPYFSSATAPRNQWVGRTSLKMSSFVEPAPGPDSPLEFAPPSVPLSIEETNYPSPQWVTHGAMPALPERSALYEGKLPDWEGMDLPGDIFLQANGPEAEFEGRHIELIALGRAFPGRRTEFYLPDGTRVLREEDMVALHQVPKRLLDGEPARFYNGPILRMIFREKGGDHFHAIAKYAFDGRTKTLVGGADGPGEECFHREGEYVALDVQLKIWHGAPLEVVIGIPSGNPEIQPMKLNHGQETPIGATPVSFTLLATGKGQVTRVENYQEKGYNPPNGGAFFDENLPGRYLITYLDRSGEPRRSAFGVKSRLALRIVRPKQLGSLDLWFGAFDTFYDFNADVFNLPEGVWEPDRDKLELRLYPDQCWIWWQIPELADFPTPRRVKNLFEVRMPEVSLEADGDLVARDELWELALAVVLNSTELHLNPKNKEIEWQKPEQDRLDFKDITPRELLGEILRAHPGLRATVDPRTHTLTLTQTKPWPERLREWWNKHAPP